MSARRSPRQVMQPGPDPATVGHGWRLFAVGRVDGGLRPPFGYGETPVPTAWTRAECRTPDEIKWLGSVTHDPAPHTTPGAACGCGWRVYPDLHAATAGAREMPERFAEYITGRDIIALAGVDYGGTLAGQHSLNLGESADPGLQRIVSTITNSWYAGGAQVDEDSTWMVNQDERHTIRAEWVRVTGPVYIAPGLARSTRRALAKRYRLGPTDLIQASERIHAALIAGHFVDEHSSTPC